MFISVSNFKSIVQVNEFDLSHLTVLAGINSSGKSSLIQALLLLKQTLDGSSNEMLNLKGPYVFANSPLDLIYNKKAGKMGFSLKFNKEELNGTDIAYHTDLTNLKILEFSVEFKVKADGFEVTKFSTQILFDKDTPSPSFPSKFLLEKKKGGKFTVTNGDKTTTGLNLDSYSFVNFFPVFANKDNISISYLITKVVRNTTIDILQRVTYIAPLRMKPVLDRVYPLDVETKYVVPDGENTRFILDRLATEKNPAFQEIKNWICEKLHLAKDFQVVKESGNRYRVVVTNKQDIKVDLMHMGLGLSQILPIITQGCISQPYSLMIVEDPDVHMHPSVQAAMADFFIFLCKVKNVAALVETHSDHFITRVRRRIAEEVIKPDLVNLVFVENNFGRSTYNSISLSLKGKLEGHMPKGFMDTADEDFRAIIQASMS